MNLENSNKLKQIFMEIFSINEIEVEIIEKTNNRKWDSLASVTLITAIESEFNIIIEDSSYENFLSFATVELALKKYNL